MTDPAHNISQDDQYTAFQIARVEQLKTASESATGEYSSRLGQLEANGIDKWAVKEALKIKKKGAAEVSEYVNKIKNLFRYLALLNLPIEDSQLELFPTVSSAEPLVDRAFKMGVLTGTVGAGMEANPHSPETEAGQAWIKGFNEGLENYQQFKTAEDEEAAEVMSDGEDKDDQTDIENND